MGLAPETSIGHYDVTDLLGEGGMGQVWQATDTQLNRQVALKILPDAFAADPDRLARFTREAQILASLNHPNIAAIHGIEEAEGTRALVLELVEGPTLADRIAKGPIPLDEALPIAKQIAEALEAAHEAGVIHRDLKPANIKAREDGTVKVLDFGLAKALDPHLEGDPSQSPTLTAAATQMGVIMGTAAFMSPEQARGKTVDKRADVWAFGVVLYEMLTGTRPFQGDDVSQTLARVIDSDPDWDRLPQTLSPVLDAYLRRCLEKEPRQRVQAIGDVRLALEGRFDTAASPATAATPAPVRGTRLAWLVAAAAVLGAAGLALPAVQHLREAPPAVATETRTEIVTPATSDVSAFALSPDGRQIVFIASGDGPRRLWLRSLAATTARPLEGTDGAGYPFWSPDSRSVGFFAGGQLKRLDLDGGAPRTLTPAVAARGGTWGTDDVILFAPTPIAPLERVAGSGGDAVQETTLLDWQTDHRFPVLLPDGRHFIFYAQGPTEPDGIFLGAIGSATTTRLTASESAGTYLPPGWLLWVREGTLVAQRLDLDRLALTGDQLTLADEVAVDDGTSQGTVAASASGLIAYRTGKPGQRQLTWFDRLGEPLGTLGEPNDNLLYFPRVSPDGRRVVLGRTVQSNTDLWVQDGPRLSRFTFAEGIDNWPNWSPDGRRIVFSSIRTGVMTMYEKNVGAGGGAEQLIDSAPTTIASDWSNDGRFLLYNTDTTQTDTDIWILPMTADSEPWIFLKTPFRVVGCVLT